MLIYNIEENIYIHKQAINTTERMIDQDGCDDDANKFHCDVIVKTENSCKNLVISIITAHKNYKE